MILKVQIKQAGRKASAIETRTIEYKKAPGTVRQLVTMTVEANVKEFRRKEDLKGNKDVDIFSAVDTALQAFEDGLVALFIDDKRFENLDEALNLTGSETLTFVKLTMLAGRMW